MKIPITCMELEDIEHLEQTFRSPIKRDENWIFLTAEDERNLIKLLNMQAEDLSLLEATVDKMAVIRGAGLLTRWIQQYKNKSDEERTIADKAALLSAVLSLYPLDPPTGRRLLAILGN